MTDPGPAIVGRRRMLITATAAIVLVAVLLFVITRPNDRTDAGSPSVAPSTSTAPSASGGSPVASSTAIASAVPSATFTAGASSSPARPATPAAPTQGPPAATAAPAEGPLSGRWSGTWTSVAPDTADGTLDIDWTQQGDSLEGTIAMTGTGCPVRGTVQGTVDGENVEFEVPGRDEVKFTGTLSGSTITGTFTQSCDSRAGSFEMKRSAP